MLLDDGVVVLIDVCVRGGGRLISSITISPATLPVPLSLPQSEVGTLRVGVSFDESAGCCPIRERFTLIFAAYPPMLEFTQTDM